MARRAKAKTEDDVSAVRSNGYDPDKTKSYVERLENLDDERTEAHMEYMNVCKRIAGDKKEVLDEAKGEGFQKKTLKAKVKERALLRKADAVRADLEAEEMDDFDLLSKALGDFADVPLGQAALARAGNGTDARA